MLKIITHILLVMAMTVGSVFAAEPASTTVVVPELTGRAVFLSKSTLIQAQEQKEIIRHLEILNAQSKVDMTVLVVDSVAPFAIEEYAIKVAEKWKIGKAKEDNGLILVVAIQDKKARFEVGYGLEGVVTDAMSSRIMNDYMIPRFKQGLWSAGIIEGIGRVNNLAQGKPLDTPLNNGLAPVKTNTANSSGSGFSSLKNLDGEALVFALIILLIVMLFTTAIGKGILIGLIFGCFMSTTHRKLGPAVACGLGAALSGLTAFYFIDGNGAWISALIAGTVFSAFGGMWLFDVLQVGLSVASSARSSGSSGGGSSYSGGGGRFGGGGSTGSW